MAEIPAPAASAPEYEAHALEGSEKTSKIENETIAPLDPCVWSGLCQLFNVCTKAGFVPFGYVNAWGVFQSYYTENILKASSPSNIAWIGSVQYSLIFIPGLVSGHFFDKGYFKIPFFVASVVLVTATFLVGQCTQYWHFLLCQGFATGISAGILFSPVSAVIGHWFKTRRGFASAFVSMGSSVGGTLFPIIARNLIPRVGFPWTLRIIGFILLCSLGCANLTVRRRLPPKHVAGGLFNWAAFKNPAYTIYCLSGIVAFLGLYTVLTYIDVRATSVGVPSDFSFYLISMANGASLCGRLAAGSMADKLGAINVVAPMTGIAAIMTYVWPLARSRGSFVAVAIVYGFSSGAYISSFTLPMYSLGDLADVGRRSGMAMTLTAIGAMAGPPISGAISTTAGGYSAVGYYAGIPLPLLRTLAILSLVAGALANDITGNATDSNSTNTNSSAAYPEDPYLRYRPPFARSLPIQILLTGVVLTLVAVLFIHLIFTAQYHWPLAPINYVLQISGVSTLLISLVATLHVVLSATQKESGQWPYMLSYVAVNVPPLDNSTNGWSLTQKATWLVMNASTSGLIQITHIQFLTLLYPSRLEARLIFALLGPLALVAAIMQLIPISGNDLSTTSSRTNITASAIKNVCNATLSLLFTTALMIWGLLVKRKDAWRTDGGTAAFGAGALALALISTGLNFLYVPREEEYMWLPGLMWAVVLWQSFLAWWWWVGSGSDPEDELRRMEKHDAAKREARKKEKREKKERRKENKKRAKAGSQAVSDALGPGQENAQPSNSEPSTAPSLSVSTASLTSTSTLPRFLPSFVGQWYRSLRHEHIVAARQQAVERVERIRELELKDGTRSGWGLGSFAWRIERPQRKPDDEDEDEYEMTAPVPRRTTPVAPPVIVRPQGSWLWGPSWSMALTRLDFVAPDLVIKLISRIDAHVIRFLSLESLSPRMERGKYPKTLSERPGSQPTRKGRLNEDLGSGFDIPTQRVAVEEGLVDSDDSDDELDSLPKSSQPNSSQPARWEKRDIGDVLKTMKFKKNSAVEGNGGTPTSKENARRNADKRAGIDSSARDKGNAVASSSTTRPLRDNAVTRNQSFDARLGPKHTVDLPDKAADPKPERPKPRPLAKTRQPQLPSSPSKPLAKLSGASSRSYLDSPSASGKKQDKQVRAGPCEFPAMSPLGDTKTGRQQQRKEPLAMDTGGRKGKGREKFLDMRSPLSSPTKNKATPSDFPVPSPLRPEEQRKPSKPKPLPFPMDIYSQLEESPASSPSKRRSSGSDDDERHRKRSKNLPVVLTESYDYEEDSELLFMAPGTDPKTLCPYCDTPLPHAAHTAADAPPRRNVPEVVQ
ncbi:MFS domain-containing protein [Mycena sanguinolenta]|uniref:MFS domain-containing protein n=1 Tax=Mycena sanguinolenta TaxID=230812 RepID=A0A8H7CUR2_9AGAR|nr:MFS domain-containing protein [Mycena sanguinolenta]